jgi:hypothetical protein
MTRLHHLETADVERSNRAQAKRRAIEERKRLALIDALQRMRQRTEAVLLDLQNAATLLDCGIEIELQSSPTRDPRHFAFPMTARALIARRDNLRATIAAISAELAKSNLNRPGFAGGSNIQRGWSHDQQDDEQVFTREGPRAREPRASASQ